MPGLKILKDLVDGLNFSKLLDSNGNNLLHALVNPKEARCNDGLRLMETVEFLYSNKINPKSKNNKDVSFWNAVSDSKSTPTVRKYLSQDFLSEMTTSTDAEIEQMEREKKQQELAEKFSKKMTRDVSRLGDDFFKNYKTWNNEKKKETILKIVKSIDSAVSIGEKKANVGDRLSAFLNEVRKHSAAQWENNLFDLLSDIEREVQKLGDRSAGARLYTLYRICDRKAMQWKNFIEKDSWYWVPRGGDPKDKKWSKMQLTQKEVSQKVSEKDREIWDDGWYFKNTFPLRCTAPPYILD